MRLFRMRPADVRGAAKEAGAGSGRVGSRVCRRCFAMRTSRRLPGRRRSSRRSRPWARRPDRFETGVSWPRRGILGRANLAVALRSFMAEGVWGTSPHLIPHFALHSASGSISLALGLHGPNLGVGGGLHAVAEGFLTALTWLSDGESCRACGWS